MAGLATRLSDEERLQGMIMELRLLEGYYNEVSARESVVARAIVEARAALDALRSFPAEGESELLMQIGGGLLMPVRAAPPERLIVTLGASVAIEKTNAAAVAFVEERIRELEGAVSTLVSQRNDLTNKINQARGAISSLVEKQQAQGQP